MKNILIATLLMISFLGNAFSQNIHKEKLDQFFQVLEENNKFMGSVVLSHKGEVIYSNQVGYEDVESLKRSSSESKYRIGSISKTFTTVLIFKAVEEKKIKLSETIDSYFPFVENADKITISNLLNHRSGIFSITDREDVDDFSYVPQTRESLLKMIEEGESIFEPGSKADYSNSNFLLLTFILEDIYKKSYSDLLDEKIIKPIALENTYLGNEIVVDDNECHSYAFEKRKWIKQKQTDMSVPLGAGAIVSNPTDISIFARSLFEGELINEASLGKMIAIKDGYGRGIFKNEFGPNIGYGHSGGIDEFVSFFSYIPKDEVCVAITSNGLNYDDGKVLMAVLGDFYGKPFTIPEFTTYNVASEELDALIGTYNSKKIPFTLTFTKEDNILYGQVNDNEKEELEASKKNIFRLDSEGIVVKFIPEQKVAVLEDDGQVFEFKMIED